VVSAGHCNELNFQLQLECKPQANHFRKLDSQKLCLLVETESIPELHQVASVKGPSKKYLAAMHS
jgi:hypothetical protein